jgi:hypothetical protein
MTARGDALIAGGLRTATPPVSLAERGSGLEETAVVVTARRNEEGLAEVGDSVSAMNTPEPGVRSVIDIDARGVDRFDAVRDDSNCAAARIRCEFPSRPAPAPGSGPGNPARGPGLVTGTAGAPVARPRAA